MSVLYFTKTDTSPLYASNNIPIIITASLPVFASELKDCLLEPPPPELSEKQILILESVVRGLSNKEIACQFGISPISAKRQLTAIFAKLGAATRAEAVGIALRKHLLKI